MLVYLLHQLQGVGPGDEIIVPSHTAFPTMEPLIHLGARPVFVDVDDTYVMDLEQVEAAITPRTVGIIPVYIYGHPADVDRVLAIAAKHRLWVIEDCAQSQGGKYKGKTVGSMGDFGASSPRGTTSGSKAWCKRRRNVNGPGRFTTCTSSAASAATSCRSF